MSPYASRPPNISEMLFRLAERWPALRTLRSALTHPAGGVTRVVWPGTTLRDFMLFDVLLHELAHHVLQQYTGKRTVRVARTADHEAYARRFAAAMRPALLGIAEP